MGMYTELHFNSELKKNIPENILDILRYMINNESAVPESLPDHDFFKTPRWRFMLQSDSYYFDADTISTLRFDEIGKSYYLCIRCNLKNYKNEIELFINWIMEYLNKEEGEFLGFYRYEEYNNPTLVYYKNP